MSQALNQSQCSKFEHVYITQIKERKIFFNKLNFSLFPTQSYRMAS